MNRTRRFLAVAALAVAAFGTIGVRAQTKPAGKRVDVVFTGGHDTDPRDRGRPVALVAAALGVPEQVFRDAFKNVKPAGRGQQPQPDQVRKNKAALMAALSKYGVTNDRLDEVSNYYRYPPGSEDLWKHKPAAAVALVKDGVITGYEIIDAGAGYTTNPTVTVPGFESAKSDVELFLGKALGKNGSIASIKVAPPATAPAN